MNKYTLLKQTITTVLFSGLSCAMDPSCKFETERDRLHERVDLVLGFMTLYKNYKVVQCEEVLFFRESRENRKTITETTPISDALRTCFKGNLPFNSTDAEIREALLFCKKLDTPLKYDHIMKVGPVQK